MLFCVYFRCRQLAINELINNYREPMREISQSGFWIGLRDAEEEGIWKWLNGERLTEGYELNIVIVGLVSVDITLTHL